MKKICFFIIVTSLLFISCNVYKQKPTAIKDTSGNLVGIAAKSSFLEAPYNSWFAPNYNNYKVDAKTLNKLKPLLKKVTIKAFMGTWCGDSKRETPILYKILDATNFNYQNLQMVTLDRSKNCPEGLQRGLNIKRVPTFIFYKEGKEIGRFVEYPVESVEKDFLKILQEKGYKNPYAN